MRRFATLSLLEASFKLTTRSEDEFSSLTNRLVKWVKVVSLLFLALVVVVVALPPPPLRPPPPPPPDDGGADVVVEDVDADVEEAMLISRGERVV